MKRNQNQAVHLCEPPGWSLWLLFLVKTQISHLQCMGKCPIKSSAQGISRCFCSVIHEDISLLWKYWLNHALQLKIEKCSFIIIAGNRSSLKRIHFAIFVVCCFFVVPPQVPHSASVLIFFTITFIFWDSAITAARNKVDKDSIFWKNCYDPYFEMEQLRNWIHVWTSPKSTWLFRGHSN